MEGIIPLELQGNYKDAITREEFITSCHIDKLDKSIMEGVVAVSVGIYSLKKR